MRGMDIGSQQSARRRDRRELLLQTAVTVFGRQGYDAAGTRAIAEQAGVNLGLITYYFGSKHDLYLAVFDHIAERLGSELYPTIEHISSTLDGPEGASPEDAITLLQQVLGRFLAVMAAPESADWARLIIREQQEPSEAFDRIYGSPMAPMAGLCTRLVACARNLSPESDQARLLAFTVIGQVLVFRAARAAALRHLGWEALGLDEIDRIRAQLDENIALILGGGEQTP